MDTVIVKSPLSGVIYPLEQVPDPVFSQKMVGDGISIDPVNDVLVAPFSGTVSQIHSACHAVTITHQTGLEVMMHIGIDTVALKGKGFTAHIKEGQEVVEGEELITFDMDLVATSAKSLLTQVILTNGELVADITKNSGKAEHNKTDLMTVTLKSDIGREEQESGQEVLSEALVIPNPTGLHARPAAVLAALAKKFDARIEVIRGKSAPMPNPWLAL